MSDILIRKEGRAGRVTLNRPKALNALNYEMCLALDAALIGWESDPEVEIIVMDAEGPKAFCAGGDIAELYHRSRAGDHDYGRSFWRDEYRMNARLAEYKKPIVSFMQGFTMGGGVGLGGHVSHRVVGESSQIAMPECGIGLVPDVGGTFILARAPGALGAFIGLTGTRLGAADAILAGFADLFLPESHWDEAKAALIREGSPDALARFAAPPPEGRLAALQPVIDATFSAPSVTGILAALEAEGSDFALETAKTLRRNSPISMAATLDIIRRLGPDATIQSALREEFRFTWRSAAETDFLEGIRAAIIDKDRKPVWKHQGPEALSAAEVQALLAPLGADDLTF